MSPGVLQWEGRSSGAGVRMALVRLEAPPDLPSLPGRKLSGTEGGAQFGNKNT